VIQVLYNKNEPDGFYTIWTRWGRVGYSGQTSQETSTQKAAIDAFKKKFKDKTGNSFDDRDSFVLKNKKYDWIKVSSLCFLL
jgi:poly [ADP-ribose] polymerase